MPRLPDPRLPAINPHMPMVEKRKWQHYCTITERGKSAITLFPMVIRTWLTVTRTARSGSAVGLMRAPMRSKQSHALTRIVEWIRWRNSSAFLLIRLVFPQTCICLISFLRWIRKTSSLNTHMLAVGPHMPGVANRLPTSGTSWIHRGQKWHSTPSPILRFEKIGGWGACWHLLDPLTCSMLLQYPSFRSLARRELCYVFDKDGK